MFSLFPKDGVFYELFEKQGDKLGEAARLLELILKEPQRLEETSAKLKELEHEADNLGHEVMDNLRRNFITPLEGEDIDLLRQDLDDIMDFMERAVNRMVIYRIAQPFAPEIKEYINIIVAAVFEVREGVKEIRDVKKHREQLHKRCEKLNDLENVGDEINRAALGRLMGIPAVDCGKVVEMIKLKEIYETLENAIDYCEDVGNLFESILIKNQ